MFSDAAIASSFLYFFLSAFILLVLWKWHTDPRYKEFSLMDLVAEKGRLSSRKFMEFGAWVASTTAFILTVIKGSATAEWLGVYCGAFVIARTLGQGVHAYKSTKELSLEEIRVKSNSKSSLFREDDQTLLVEEEKK